MFFQNEVQRSVIDPVLIYCMSNNLINYKCFHINRAFRNIIQIMKTILIILLAVIIPAQNESFERQYNED